MATKKYKDGQIVEIPHNQISVVYNIRQNADVQDEKLLSLLQSIRESGLQDPIVVTPNLIHIDGQRRLTALNLLAQERGVDAIDVKVRIMDIPEKDIPLYQYLSGHERKNISAQDTMRAISTYAEKNPDVPYRQLSVLFNSSPATVFRCTKIQRVPSLNELCKNSLVTQNAALQVIDYFLGDTDSEELDNERTLSALERANKLGEQLVANISASLANNEDEKKPKPWNLRNINSYLVSIGEPEIPNKKSEGEGSSKKKEYNIVGIVQRVLDTFIISPCEGDEVQLTGKLPREILEVLQELIQEKKKGELKEEESSATGQDAWETWIEYKKVYPNHVIIVQQSASRYRSYEDDMIQLEQVAGIEPVIENSIKIAVLNKKELRSPISQLINKGIDVLRINKVHVENRKKKTKQQEQTTQTNESNVLAELDEQIKQELEEISTIPTTQPNDKFAKLNEKLSTPSIIVEEDATETDEEDEEFELLASGTKSTEDLEAYLSGSGVFADEQG